MLKKKKTISLIITTIMLVAAFGASSYGASISKTLQAYYGTSRIIIDGQDVTTAIEPFIVEGTIYIPLRVVANAFNKNVHWDNTTATATITDDLTQVNEYYQTEILRRDVEILNLRRDLERLQKELEVTKEISLSDLEKELNKEFDEYRDIEFSIKLSGKTSDVEVRIDVDLDDYEDEWNDLSTSRRTSYLQDIVDEILDAYPNADVEGYVRDTDAKKTILEFTVDKKGAVKIESKSSSMDIGDLEEELDDEYHDYFSNIDLYIVLEGDEDDIEFYIDVDYRKHGTAWDKLSDTAVRNLMSYIYDDIEDTFEDASIEGFVWDTHNDEELAEYYRTSSGNERFTRY